MNHRFTEMCVIILYLFLLLLLLFIIIYNIFILLILLFLLFNLFVYYYLFPRILIREVKYLCILLLIPARVAGIVHILDYLYFRIIFIIFLLPSPLQRSGQELLLFFLLFLLLYIYYYYYYCFYIYIYYY